jgi:hypothetical protein
MAQLIQWDKVGEKVYETGVDHGVYYALDALLGTYPKGVAWNGLVSITESPSGAEANPQFADNIKYLNLLSAEEFGGTIEAFTYPAEFAASNGELEAEQGVTVAQQARVPFGLAYRTIVGNDSAGQAYGYKLHLVYGCLVSPSEKAYQTINESPEAITFSWEFTTTPAPVTGFKPTASIVIDSTVADPEALAALEVILYGVTGTPNTEGRLPLPDEVVTLMAPIP